MFKIDFPMCCWRTCVTRKPIPCYILLVDYHDEVARYVPNISKQTTLNKQTKVIQEVVSPKVSRLNHSVMNKKQGDEIQFNLEKRLKKGKLIQHTSLSTHHFSL